MRNIDSWNIRKAINGFAATVSWKEDDNWRNEEIVFTNASDVYTWLSKNGLND